MSQNINVTVQEGRLTADPELKQLPSGDKVIEFSIACNRRVQNKTTQQWEDVPDFFDVSLFGNRAEWLANDLHKGKRVVVYGRLRQDRWVTDDGQKRSKLKIIAYEIGYDRPAREDGQQAGQQAPQQAYQRAPVQAYQTSYAQVPAPVSGPNPYDSDIPF